MNMSRADHLIRDVLVPAVLEAAAWTRVGEMEIAADTLCVAIYVGAVPRATRVAAIMRPLRVVVIAIDDRVHGRTPVVRADHPALQLADRLLQRRPEVGAVARSGELLARNNHLIGR